MTGGSVADQGLGRLLAGRRREGRGLARCALGLGRALAVRVRLTPHARQLDRRRSPEAGRGATVLVDGRAVLVLQAVEARGGEHAEWMDGWMDVGEKEEELSSCSTEERRWEARAMGRHLDQPTGALRDLVGKRGREVRRYRWAWTSPGSGRERGRATPAGEGVRRGGTGARTWLRI